MGEVLQGAIIIVSSEIPLFPASWDAGEQSHDKADLGALKVKNAWSLSVCKPNSEQPSLLHPG